jgi:ribosomal protein S18 acetylase RimI-like enzyme
MGFNIKAIDISSYVELLALWKSTEGVGLSESDSLENIRQFLSHNPGLSYAAWDNDLLVGTVLCGHDGRRGYIHHLAVRRTHRRQGIGTALVEECLESLKGTGIMKCHLFVFSENDSAISFWHDTGWTQRTDLIVMSHFTGIQSA